MEIEKIDIELIIKIEEGLWTKRYPQSPKKFKDVHLIEPFQTNLISIIQKYRKKFEKKGMILNFISALDIQVDFTKKLLISEFNHEESYDLLSNFIKSIFKLSPQISSVTISLYTSPKEKFYETWFHDLFQENEGRIPFKKILMANFYTSTVELLKYIRKNLYMALKREFLESIQDEDNGNDIVVVNTIMTKFYQ